MEEDSGSNSLEGPIGCVGTRRRGSHLSGEYVLEGGCCFSTAVNDIYHISHELYYSE